MFEGSATDKFMGGGGGGGGLISEHLIFTAW